MSKLLDLKPLLRRKRAKDCDHMRVSVDDDIASLTCDDCESELDPWWYIRQLAHDVNRTYDTRQEQEEQYQSWLAKANEQIARLNAEINALVETKNRLWNEQVEGQPLGTYVRRTRRKVQR